MARARSNVRLRFSLVRFGCVIAMLEHEMG